MIAEGAAEFVKITDTTGEVSFKLDENVIFEKPDKSVIGEISYKTLPTSIKAESRINIKIQYTYQRDEADGSNAEILDTEGGDEIVIYDCPDDYGCDDCLSLPSEYKCIHCDGQCKPIGGQCIGGAYTSWDKRNFCPHPKITSIWPKNATVSGYKTILEIIGRDLSTQDVIKFGDRQCVFDKQTSLDYGINNLRRAFMCKLQKSPPNLSPSIGPVDITISPVEGNPDKVTSLAEFNILKPVIEGIEPQRILQIGGTRLTIKGINLNVGRSVSVVLADKYVCDIISDGPVVENPPIICEVQPIDKSVKLLGLKSISVKIDGSDELNKQSAKVSCFCSSCENHEVYN